MEEDNEETKDEQQIVIQDNPSQATQHEAVNQETYEVVDEETYESVDDTLNKQNNYGEDMAYMCLHFTKDHKGTRINTPYPEKSIRHVQAFPMSLTGAASRWLRNKSSGSITTWEDLKTNFLSKYCPPARTAKKLEEINNFQQEPDETLYQAWERFKELLMKCPQHYLMEMQETDADAKVAIQEMTEYSQKWHNRTSRTRSTENSDGLAAIQAQLNNLGREIKKVNEKVYAAQVGCEQCKGPYYTKYCPLKEEGKTLEEAYYTHFGRPFQRGGYRAAAPGFYQRNNANPSCQEQRQSMEETLSKFMRASIKTLEIQIRQISKVLQERGFGSLPRSTEANMRDHVKSISTTVEADSNPIRHMGLSQYAVSSPQNRRLMIESRQTKITFPSCLNDYCCEEKKVSYGPQFLKAYSYGASHIDNSIPRKENDPGSFTLPCYLNNVCFDNALADLGASVSVMPLSTYLNLGLGELAHTKLTVELADRNVKYPKGIAENVLVGFSKFVFPVDFIILDIPEDVKVSLIPGIPFLSTAYAKIDVFKRKITLRVGDEKIIFKKDRLMGETLVLNRSLDPLNGDYIELNDLNVPLELRRDQVDDLMPIIKEGEVVDAHMDDLVETRNDELDTRINDYLGCCDYDKKIRIDCAHNLKFSCMIGFEFIHVNFFLILYVNVMSKKFYNSIMKDKLEYKGNNVLGALMSVPIFVGTFYVVTDFAVLEDMDAYRDEGMGDVVFGESFLKQIRIKARRFEVNEHDKLNEISHPYQKLKSFYKEVLNLGPEYVRDAKMEEWLTGTDI
ncbi:hypothetical protein Tco_0363056 [Tanacetum coccineum]